MNDKILDVIQLFFFFQTVHILPWGSQIIGGNIVQSDPQVWGIGGGCPPCPPWLWRKASGPLTPLPVYPYLTQIYCKRTQLRSNISIIFFIDLEK